MHAWNDDRPLYRQLRHYIVGLILDGVLDVGDAIPSARAMAAEYRINPLTVLKAYQQLADEGVVESRRGLGMFVTSGAPEMLLAAERRRFLSDEWPRIRETIERLGLTPEELRLGSEPARRSPTRRAGRSR